METDMVSTKYFGLLDLEDLPVPDGQLFAIPLDGRETLVEVSWLIIAADAFSERDRQDFLDAMDSVPQMYALAKARIRSALAKRTLLRRRIKDPALRDFAAALGEERSQGLPDGLMLREIVFGQGPFGEFCCELYFGHGPAGGPTLAAEFSSATSFSRFYSGSSV